jgi:hypothetical protein
MEEMKEVFKHRLEDTGGILDAIRAMIRAANAETFTSTIVMNPAVKDLFETITSRLPQVCSELFETALLEVFDMMVPRSCTYFNQG